VGHFQNPPTYDSGWLDITGKAGQYITIVHNLNSTDVMVDITGKTTANGGAQQKYLGGTDFVAGWNKTYGKTNRDFAEALVQTADGGYALAGRTESFGAGSLDFWLVKTDANGNMQWNKTYGGTSEDRANALVQTTDGGYAIAGYTTSFGAGDEDAWLIKTDAAGNALDGFKYGLAWVASTANATKLYRGTDDVNWNYVRVRIWLIKEPTWIYGDINMDGVVDAKDLYILGRNYGKSVSLLSLGGIIGIAGIRTVKKRKQAN